MIVYDIVKDGDGGYPTGKHGVLAGGDDRNTDNSVEENDVKGTSICMKPGDPGRGGDPPEDQHQPRALIRTPFRGRR